MPSITNNILDFLSKNSKTTAIIHNGIAYTYEELNLHSDKIANYLIKNKTHHKSIVAFCMRRSFDMLAIIIAIWKLGATYVPLDPKTPSQRIKKILEDIEPACVVCDPSLLSKFNLQNTSTITLHDPDFINIDKDEIRPKEISETELAYIIYTSGSTGEPKGVMLTHDNLANHVFWLIKDFGFSAADCFSFNSSMAFDFTVACTLIPLTVGAKIVITSEVDTLDIDAYCKQLEDNKVTFVKWTPSYFRLLIDYVEEHKPDFSSLRYIMIAGEELLTSYAEKWFNIYPSHILVNEYGPTEAAVGITINIFTKESLNNELHTVPIGKPAINSNLYVVDSQNKLVEEGETGELLIGGKSVSPGYYKKLALTKEKFIDNPFDKKSNKLYRTGDLVKKLPDGSFLYICRVDNQVKVNGYRIELTEIEHHILRDQKVKYAKLAIEKTNDNRARIIAYLVSKEENKSIQLTLLKERLLEQLPHFMIPSQFFIVSHIPTNKNGKVDYAALKKLVKLDDEASKDDFIEYTLREKIQHSLKTTTGIINSDPDATFFSLGITSLDLAEFVNDVNNKCNAFLKLQEIFSYPTLNSLIAYIEKKSSIDEKLENTNPNNTTKSKNVLQPIAIISMDCRLPGANNCDELWDLCKNGKETIAFFTPPENKAPASSQSEKTVYARGILEGIEDFDASFFGFNAKDAHLTDPQHRLLIESAWVAFEKAGYIPEQDGYKVGIYVSMNDSTYILNHNLIERFDSFFSDRFALQRLMSPQCLATKIAYSLNCTGPTFTIQTTCSASLVSVVLACQQLSSYQCDIALAGGVSIITPQEKPYTYQKNNIFSPDGHCRPFDADAEGTVFSNGLGTVVLKRLEDALRDNDHILCVIKGANTNNDGQNKMSYTAPTVEGQMSCILSAQKSASIEADSIQYVETHGTGTFIGDPIEIEAISKAFRTTTKQQQYCALGALKANIGHTHVAAGIAGLIKTVCAINNSQIPPLINIENPNPHIDWENSPFYLNTKLQYWPKGQTPRRAAVSAFGVGGTNAHVILEEAPQITHEPNFSRKNQILLLSAKSNESLDKMRKNLVQFLKNNYHHDHSNNLLADLAYTLQVGRKNFPYKTGSVCSTIQEAITSLEEGQALRASNQPISDLQTIFLFSGKKCTDNLNFAKTLYREEPLFKQQLDECLKIGSSCAGIDLKEILLSPDTQLDNAIQQINPTAIMHLLLFCVEYALAQLLLMLDIKPNYLLGDGLGEYVAATLANVFSLADALKLVYARGKVIAEYEKDSMLKVPLNATPENASSLNIKNPHPYSTLQAIALKSFLDTLQSISKQKPTIPYFSSSKSDWINELDIQQDSYWIDQMFGTDQFLSCVEKLNQLSHPIIIEVGLGSKLLSLMCDKLPNSITAIQLMPNYQEQEINNKKSLENALKTIWCTGLPINWHNYHKYEKRQRIPIPTYPFEKSRYWFDELIQAKNDNQTTLNSPPVFYVPTWHRESIPLSETTMNFLSHKNKVWIIFANDSQICSHIISQLKISDHTVWIIKQGFNYERNNNQFFINPREILHYEKMVQEIINGETNNYAILHFWSMNQNNHLLDINSVEDPVFYNGFYSGLFLIKAFSKTPGSVISCTMITNQLQTVIGTEKTVPLVSSVLSLCRVLPLENQNLRFSNIDIQYKLASSLIDIYSKNIINTTLEALDNPALQVPCLMAYRGQYAWQPLYASTEAPELLEDKTFIKSNGLYLITGGLGAMGLTIAEWISKNVSATFVLLSRKIFPLEKDWDKWKKDHATTNPITLIINKLQTIMSNGSKVIIINGDVANFRQIKPLIKNVFKKHGNINGIFHLAGIPGEGLAVLKEVGMIKKVLHPKIQGTIVLANLFKQKELDFFISASSLTAIAGGIGQLDYCAANLFLDYFVTKKQFIKCKRLLNINWNSWSSIGMATHLGKSQTHEKLYSENSLSPDEAMELLVDAMRSNDNQVIISRVHPKIERERIIAAFVNLKKNCSSTTKNTQSHAANAYNIIEEMWCETLGINSINKDDTFYSLGGDSLSAIQLLSKLEEKLHIDISLQEFAHVSTLDSLLKLIESKPLRSSNPIITFSNNVTNYNQPEIYFIHPLGGTIFKYFSLMPYLNSQFNYHGIQDPELSGNETLFYSIKDMARNYAAEISKHQNKRLILVGASFGGNIAIEMVEFLNSSGCFVEKVILIDSWAKFREAIPEKEESNYALESLKVMKAYYGENSCQYLFIKKRLSWLRSYTPSIINTDLILLKAEELLPFYKKITCVNNGWNFYCSKDVQCYMIKGNHDTMFQSKHLVELGKILNTLIMP